jgi:hypothetical protein
MMIEEFAPIPAFAAAVSALPASKPDSRFREKTPMVLKQQGKQAIMGKWL